MYAGEFAPISDSYTCIDRIFSIPVKNIVS